MVEIAPGLYIGSLDDCPAKIPTIHALKDPCYLDKSGTWRRGSPRGLFFESGDNLYLNMVDARSSKYFSAELFTESLKFIDRFDEVLIHCNAGQSRAPSIGLLWMAKRVWGSASFTDACIPFLEIYPDFDPGPGIRRFLSDHWKELN